MLNIKNADTLQTIYSACFHTTVKYRIALLGTLLIAEMYSLQRSKLLELWLTQNTKIHVDACFYDWKLFPLPCEYVFLLTNFFINKQENFQANESVHNIKIGNKYHFYILVANLLYAQVQTVLHQNFQQFIMQTQQSAE
jgi:hypothetical protein